jgi:hypothetical protein
MKINYDPTVNLGHLVSVLGFAILGTGAYYDLKSDVRNSITVADQRWEQQKIVDTNQDNRLTDIKTTLQANTDDIKKKIDWMATREPKR